MQPVSNHASPHKCAHSGANWLKWVGPSMVAALKPIFFAIASSWIETWPS